MRLLIAAAALLVAEPAAAADPESVELSEAERSQLQQNLDRGFLLYRYDQSAWHVTDAALAALSDAAKTLVRGYVTTPAPNGLRTTFFKEDGGLQYVVYSAVWTGSAIEDAKVHAAGDRVPVSDEERRLIGARKLALASQQQLDMCSPAPPNVIVIPVGSSAAAVYVLTPQTTEGSYPLGGHHRIDIANAQVVGARKFTNSCLEMSLPAGEKPEALFVTHLLDPVPTEIHVFSVFAIGIPLYVGVSDRRMFAVEVVGDRPRARLIEGAPGADSR